ncbi:cache domain-containing protein [Rugamonas apoptosis]|uniref:Cache domain-containing protein n=1 Tax=Rugamonas apoptosis TaxID=2758570 RepID=A0A7W2FE28_9BURK|nr:cache domain-containing protein [Rugamonas apoptosis]MBA5689937.1 cache domain-containing protein [Rugamonas apoptosis]
MKTLLKFLVVLFLGQILTSQASDIGTADEALSMVKRAIALLDKKGKDEAFKQFNDTSGPFVDRDLYIAVLDAKGTMVAHGANPRIIGKSLIEMKDADGKQFIKTLIDMAQKNRSGWVEYKWPNPVTKVIEPKSTYVEKFGDLTVACGIYKK